MKCRDLMVGDWCCSGHGLSMQITNVGEDYAYATWEGNEGDPWEFDDKDDQPKPIPLTKEMLDANGFRYEDEDDCFGTYFCSRIENCESDSLIYYIRVRWEETSEGRKPINIYCSRWENSKNSSATIKSNLYVHTLQHALRLVGLSEIADNFKV